MSDGIGCYAIRNPEIGTIPLYTTLYIAGRPCHLVKKEGEMPVLVWGEVPKDEAHRLREVLRKIEVIAGYPGEVITLEMASMRFSAISKEIKGALQ